MARDRRAKFIELANNRVNRTLRDMRLIGNLSNKSAYDYNEEDVRRIIRALQRELESVKARFGGPGAGGHSEFSLL
jgi:hypothetical protein